MLSKVNKDRNHQAQYPILVQNLFCLQMFSLLDLAPPDLDIQVSLSFGKKMFFSSSKNSDFYYISILPET